MQLPALILGDTEAMSQDAFNSTQNIEVESIILCLLSIFWFLFLNLIQVKVILIEETLI